MQSTNNKRYKKNYFSRKLVNFSASFDGYIRILFFILLKLEGSGGQM